MAVLAAGGVVVPDHDVAFLGRLVEELRPPCPSSAFRAPGVEPLGVIREVDDRGDHWERHATEVEVQSGAHYVPSAVPKRDDKRDDRGIRELDLIDRDHVDLRIDECREFLG